MSAEVIIEVRESERQKILRLRDVIPRDEKGRTRITLNGFIA